jgi:hypothetical protein
VKASVKLVRAEISSKYINRAGTNLPQRRRTILERAKDELRSQFGRDRKAR